MTKEEILEYFKDINFMYNEPSRLDSLNHMLDELMEPCEDAVSREFMYKLGAKCIAARNENGTLVSIASIESLPSVNPRQKWRR